MTESQFCAWLLFAIPVLACFGNKGFSFNESLIVAIVFFLSFPLPLFIMAEREFIKNCKKGYTDWEESVLPQFIYKKYRRNLE